MKFHPVTVLRSISLSRFYKIHQKITRHPSHDFLTLHSAIPFISSQKSKEQTKHLKRDKFSSPKLIQVLKASGEEKDRRALRIFIPTVIGSHARSFFFYGKVQVSLDNKIKCLAAGRERKKKVFHLKFEDWWWIGVN